MKNQKLYMGIDVSKGYADFLILTAQKKVFRSNFQLDDNQTGHQVLKNYLVKLLEQHVIVSGVENTGGYESNWVQSLKKLSSNNKRLEVYKVNPKAVKHQIQSLLKTNIDDAVSAEGIATYLMNNYDTFKQNWVNSMTQTKEVSEGKMLHRMIQSLIKQKTMKLNQLEKVLYQSFPEILTYMKYSTPNWILSFLQKYPSAESVKRAKIKGIISIKGISRTKAEVLKLKAKSSVAGKSGRITELLISQMCKDIATIRSEIKMLKNELEMMFDDDKRVEIVTSLKGIAKWSAASFLIELGDEKRFKTTSQLAGFFGVNPAFKISGDGIFKVRMSKQGSSTMRAILYTIANNLVLHNEHFRSIYAKHRARGKKHKAVMGIIMHKALRILWGMLMSNTTFDEKIDNANIEKNHQENQNRQISKKARRMQEITLDAPISRANSKKRKAMLESQSLTENESTRSSEHSLMQT